MIDKSSVNEWRIRRYADDDVSIEHFGASAAYTTLFEQFGFTPDHVVAAAHASLEKAGRITGTTTGT